MPGLALVLAAVLAIAVVAGAVFAALLLHRRAGKAVEEARRLTSLFDVIAEGILVCSGLQVIAAVVIGGTSLAGGSGTIIGAALGVLIITTIDSGLVFYNVNLNYSEFVTGIVIIGAIALDRIAKRRRSS